MSIPSNPSEPNATRLRELQRTELLNSPTEEVFDRFTALASQILSVPVVFISLVDEERQFFKSQIGLPKPWADKRGTPLSHSFCQYVVASKEPLIINDARKNALVSGNPAIEELGVIAYAGIPLITPQGEAIGSFVAIDSQPRQWTEHEVKVLQGLAGAVMTEIALRLNAQQLQRTAARLGGILESIGDAFFQLDRNWCFAYLNEQSSYITERPREELLGRNLWEEVPALLDSVFERHYREAVATGKPVAFEEYFEPMAMWMEIHAYPGDDGLSVYIQDITARKKSEERLRLLESSVVNANDTILITEAWPIDEPGPRILYVNDAFTRMTGYSSEEVLGKSPRFLQGPETEREPLDRLGKSLEKQEAAQVELINYRKDGSTFWVEMSIVPITDEQGKRTHWISVQRDVTERRQVQERLRAARDEAEMARQEAERANLAKSEFLSRMSHELRTPLNAILGFGQLLEMDELQGEQERGVQQILKGGRHLLELINDVLDIASIESAQQPLDIVPVPVAQTLHDALDLVRPLAATRGIQLSNGCSAEVGTHLLADQRRFNQVLLNLLANAVKYNREGGSVVLSCDSDAKRVRVSVRDEGLGIAPENIEHLFTPFERLGAERSAIEGTGLGLTLSKRLVEAMDGSITVHSVVGKGSTFTIELPLASGQEPLAEAPDSHEVKTPEPGDKEHAVVLYIEDNLSNVGLVQTILGHRPHIKLLNATLARTGLEMAQQQHPDLILLDFYLPDLKGDEVLRLLREAPETRSIPVVAVSADAMPYRIDQLFQAGAQAYLTKPLDIKQFLRVVDEALQQGTSPHAR